MILVTGGTGRIGARLVAALTGAGIPAAICVRTTGPAADADRSATLRIGSAACPAWLRDHASAVEAVVHLASPSAHHDPAGLEACHALAVALWEGCCAAGIPFVYASSAAVYGDGHEGCQDLDDPDAVAGLRPLTPYGAYKRRLDLYAASANHRPPRWAGLRFSNVYGFDDGRGKTDFFSRVLADLQAGRPPRLYRSPHPAVADGGQRRDFLHVDDCVRVLRWVLGNPLPSGLYNVGSGQPHSYREAAACLCEACGLPARFEYVPVAPEHAAAFVADLAPPIAKLRAAGYGAPFVSLQEGLRRLARPGSGAGSALPC
jgi:ADP-L-glycero-D-manno-heptose 6-epimerase